MGIWSLGKVISELKNFSDESEREIINLAGWLWEEGMSFSMEQEIELTKQEEEKLFAMLVRLKNGEPVQYIVGHAWFYGLELKVSPAVLIPRPETEELAGWIISDYRKREKDLRILDIGTGSGCIAIVLKHYFKDRAKVIALDISLDALDIAKKNAKEHNTEIQFIHMDFLKDGLEGLGQFDIIVSNPPYVSRSTASENADSALAYEPALALYPLGDDPDIFYKEFSRLLPAHLSGGGACYLELNEFRMTEAAGFFKNDRWTNMEVRHDMQGKPRMLKVLSM